MDEFTPAGSGSLRDGTRRVSRQTVATFTPTRTLHPDQIWNPLGGELEPRPKRSRSREDRRKDGLADLTPHEEVAGQVRAVLRPGG
jgi:hypothetical protein